MSPVKFCGISLIVLSIFLLFIFLLKKNETYFNLYNVVRNHLRLFKNSKFQYIVFYIFPLSLSIGLAIIYTADVNFYTQMIVVVGILVSMQFSLLSILCGYNFNSVKCEIRRNKIKNVVQETVNAIVFDCILCLGLLLYGLIMIALGGEHSPVSSDVVWKFLAGGVYYIFTIILLNLLLIVKHMSRIIEFNLYFEE